MLKLKISIVCFSAILLTVSCANEKKNSPVSLAPKPSTIEQTASNDSLIQEFALLIEDSMYEGDSKSYLSRFDFERFMDFVTYSQNPELDNQRFAAGFRTGMGEGIKSLPEKISQTTANGGYYDYINYSYDEDAKTYTVLFRLFSDQEGLNYHKYQLAKFNEKIHFEDIYVYATGEKLSETSRKLFFASLPKNILQKIIHREDAPDMEHLINASTHIKSGQYTMAFDNLKKVEGRLKNERIFHVLKITTAAQLSDEEYIQALTEMKNTFGNDPTMNLLSIDYHFLKGEYDKAMESVDNLEASTGDNFLDFYRGNIYQYKGDHENAIAFYDKVIENYPDYYNASLNQLVSYSYIGKFDECVTILEKLTSEDFFPEDLISYVEDPGLEETSILQPLMDSKDYQTWKTSVSK